MIILPKTQNKYMFCLYVHWKSMGSKKQQHWTPLTFPLYKLKQLKSQWNQNGLIYFFMHYC